MTLTSLPIFLWFQESEETVPDAGREQILRVAGSDGEPSAAGQPGPPRRRLQAGSGVASRSWTAEGKEGVSQEHILCAQPRQRWEKQQAEVGEAAGCSVDVLPRALHLIFSSYFAAKTSFQGESVHCVLSTSLVLCRCCVSFNGDTHVRLCRCIVQNLTAKPI